MWGRRLWPNRFREYVSERHDNNEIQTIIGRDRVWDARPGHMHQTRRPRTAANEATDLCVKERGAGGFVRDV